MTEGFGGPKGAWGWASIAMLLLGFALGGVAHGNASWKPAVDAIQPFGDAWVNLLRVIAVPLTLCLLISGLGSMQARAGKWTSSTMAAILGMLIVATVFAYLGTHAYLRLVPIQPLDQQAFEPAESVDLTFAQWVGNLIPKNAFAAAVAEDILGLTILAILFGLALRSVAPDRKQAVLGFVEGVRDALFTIVRWALIVAPIGAFALALGFTAKYGLHAAGAAGQMMLLSSGLLILFTGLLYPVAVLMGRVGWSAFARAVFPAQTLALATRSSIACLPTLVEGAEKLKLPDEAREVSLPMTIALFKLNRPITTMSKLLFMAALYGIGLHPGTIAVFALTVLALSVASPGIPNSGGANSTTGAYLAAGMPMEGIVILDILTPITDLFRTALNVTADLVAAILATRWSGGDP